MEKIGVESIFITKEFDQGIRDYNNGLKQGGTRTREFAKEVEDALKKAEEAVKKAARAYSKDYMEGLNRGTIGTKDFQSQLMASAATMGLSTKEISRMAGASGLYTEQQLKAAEASKNVAKKADELTKAVASGKMTAQEAGKQFAAYAKTQEVVAASSDKLTDKTKGLNKAWGDFRNQVPGLDRALNLLTNPITLIGVGLVALGKFARDSFKEFVTYADQVRDLSRALGTNAEASSKLIQVADDLFVSYDTLKVAMKKAQKEGINPNIEGLMQLAGQYQAIPDPAARSAFAMKMFGKAGMEMAKILEKTPAQLQAMGDSLEGSSLIMSQQGVDAAYRYKQQMDELGDTLTEVKYVVGEDLLPEILKVNKALLDGITVMKTDNIARAAYNKLLSYGAINQKEYNDAVHAGVSDQDMMMGGVTKTGQAVVMGTDAMEDATAKLKEYRDSTMDARDRIAEIIPVLAEESEEMGTLEDATERAKEAQDRLKSKLGDLQSFVAGPLASETESYKGKIDGLNEKLGETAKKIDELNKKDQLTEEQKAQLGELQTEYGKIIADINATAAAHDEATKRILFNILVQRASMEELSGSELEVLMGIAKHWGLVDEATANYTINADKNLTAMANGQGIEETKAALMDIDTMTRNIPTSVNINIRTTYTEFGTPPATGGAGSVRPGRRAAGGQAVGGSSYIVGENGPELFVPEKSGQVISNRDMKENYSVGYSTRGDQVIVLPKATASKTSVTYSPAMAAQPVANSYSNAATVNMGGVNIYNGMGEGELAAAIRRVMRSEMAGV